MIRKEVIKRNFSRYARLYDKYSGVQRDLARCLISRTPDHADRILDIGCGTGIYTELLKKRFPGARIKAIDISRAMIDVAREKLGEDNLEFILNDAERVNLKGQFDLVTSNASFQWFQDLEKTLSRYKKILDKKGVIVFSMFGPGTFYELGESVRELFGEDSKIASRSFLTFEHVRRILSRLFKNSEVKREIFKYKYATFTDLLKSIKYSGIRGSGVSGKGIRRPGDVLKLEDIYRRKFSAGGRGISDRKIITTYEVFFCKGEK